MRIGRGGVSWMAVAMLVVGGAARAGEVDRGRLAYERHCMPCHGATGRGDGPNAAAFTPPPRDLHAFVAGHESADVASRILDGRSMHLGIDPSRVARQSSDVEALVTYLERLPRVDWRRAERGEELWVARCETCHGRYGRPGPTLPPGARQPRDLSDPAFQRGVGDAQLADLIRHGRRGMPAIPGLERLADREALVAYVRLLSPGFELYTRWCASCHGEEGLGDRLVDPGAAPLVRFDRSYFAKHDAETLRTKVWHMLDEQKPGMPHFRRSLGEADVRAIVEFLRRMP